MKGGLLICPYAMRIATWNCGGFNDPTKLVELKRLISVNRIQVFGLLETREKVKNIDRICHKVARGWKWCHNYQYSSKGRIWVGWDTNKVQVQVQVVSVSEQFTVRFQILHVT